MRPFDAGHYLLNEQLIVVVIAYKVNLSTIDYQQRALVLVMEKIGVGFIQTL